MQPVAARVSQDRQPGSRWAARVCAWCRHPASARPGGPQPPASHGICPRCLAALLAALPPVGAVAANAPVIASAALRRGAPP
jgi:hypothetical protein